jgi:plastocyanin
MTTPRPFYFQNPALALRRRLRVIFLAAALASLVAQHAMAAELAVKVVDATGKPGTQLAVLAHPVNGSVAATIPARPVQLVQQFQAFAPEVTAVAVGTTVEFPNLDRMRHHVYSFSATKPFEIRLYSGDEIPKVTFDKPGVVAIGCNIHDWMEGYVYVTDAPYFASTDATGTALLRDLPPGEYRLTAWHPGFAAEIEMGVATAGTKASFELSTNIELFSQRRPDNDPLLIKFRSLNE